MPYYGPRFQPTAPRNIWDELADIAARGASGYLTGLDVKEQGEERKRAEEDRAEGRSDRARRRAFEDFERGALPAGAEPAPRTRREYPATQIPDSIIQADPADSGFLRSPAPVGDEGFERRPIFGPEDAGDEGFQRRPGPRGVADVIADMLGEGQPMQDLRPRRYPGLDPYEAGGRTFDPELALERRGAQARAESGLAREIADEDLAREAAEMEAAGVPAGRARLAARIPGVATRELYPPKEEPRDIDPNSPEGIEAYRRRLQVERDIMGPRRDPDRDQIPPIDRALDSLLQLYGTWNAQTRGYDPPEGATREWLIEAAEAFRRGQKIPPIPKAGDRIGSLDLSALFGQRQAPYRPGAVPRTEVPMRPGVPRPTAGAPAPEAATAKLPVSQAEYDEIVTEMGARYAEKHFEVMR